MREILVDGCAGRAAIRAGYSPRTADQIAYRLVQKSSVREQIRVAMEERAHRNHVDQDRVIQELLALIHADIGDLFNDDQTLKPVHEWPEHWRTNGLVTKLDIQETWRGRGQSRTLIRRETRIRFADRAEILKELGKRLGAF